MGRWSVLRLAAAGLILMGLAVVIGSTYLISMDKDIPDGIIALGSAAVGALATLMTTSSFSEASSGTMTIEQKVEPPPVAG